MQTNRFTGTCSSTCLTSGRWTLPAVLVGTFSQRCVRVQARNPSGGGRSVLNGIQIPANIIKKYPGGVRIDGNTAETLASSEVEPDVELLLPGSTASLDATSTFEEDNPYSSADALSTAVEGLAGGEPALEALLAEQGANLSAERIKAIFPFELDGFQQRALELFLEGRSVVVCAPTGAGKTAIAEAAAAATLARGQRVIYTTPLKALSNQKLFETRRRFGHARCGLQTGDTSLNTDGDIVVMTTEILRNIMYRTEELAQENNTGSGATREARLGNVGLIVLDEVHYLGDPHRGSVWEEAIINCPRHIQLLCMSATVANPTDLGDWIAKEHMPCETIQTRFRPVPLHWQFAFFKAGKGIRLVDLMKREGNKQMLNPALSNRQVFLEEAGAMLGNDPTPQRPGDRRGGRKLPPVPADIGSSDPWDWEQAQKDLETRLDAMYGADPQAIQRRINVRRMPDVPKTVKALATMELLPAIWFILSRRDCDANAIRVASVSLTTREQQSAIAQELAGLQADSPEAVRDDLVPALLNGVASHHAGQLPGWKSLVERLFQRGLLKLVFATGTLAAGINMPARTTVISSLSRITDEGPKLMPHNELLQMAGRAGRRGFDTEGTCVVLQNKFEGAEEAWRIIKAGPEPLVSQFSVSYGLVLNLLSVKTLEQAREFVSRSFGNYMATEGYQRRMAEADQLEKEARQLVESFKASATAGAKEINVRLKAAKDEVRRLRSAQLAAQCDAAKAMLEKQPMPRLAVINLSAASAFASGGGPGVKPLLMPVIIVGEAEPPPPEQTSGPGKEPPPGPYYACLSADNRLMRASVMCVAGVLEQEAQVVVEGGEVEVVRKMVANVRRNAWSNVEAGSWALQASLGNMETSSLARRLESGLPFTFLEPESNLSKEIAAGRKAVKAITKELEDQRRVASSGSKKDGSLETMAKAKRLLKKVEKLREQGLDDSQLEGTWRTFQVTMEILICMEAMEINSLRVLPLGQLARNIQGGNELWLALALSHPVLHTLSGPGLAALLGALLSPEVLSKPLTVRAAYPVSAEVEAAVEALEPVRQLLLELQTDAGLTKWNDALLVDLRFAGLVEAWASGATWSQIMGDCNVDDGDIARLLIRTIDLLKQLRQNAHLLPQLKDAAMEALRGMDRKPVAEVTM